MLSLKVCELAYWHPLEAIALYSLQRLWALKALSGVSSTDDTTNHSN